MIESLPVLFPVPQSTVLWRYMDFAQYVSILTKSKLFFSKVTAFKDPYEGMPSKVDHERFRNDYNKGGQFTEADPIGKNIVKAVTESMKHIGIVNCWHGNRHQSAAMWSLYSKSSESIAIKTTCKYMHRAFALTNAKLFISKIKYIDYSKESMEKKSSSNIMSLVHKRKSFEHEKEVRLIYWDLLNNFEQAQLDCGVYVDVNAGCLIREVYVSPESQGWFLRLVEEFTRKQGIKCPVRKSDLYDPCIY